MQEIINVMQYSFSMAGGSAGLSAVFLACLMALWHYKFEKELEIKNLFWYAIVMLTIIVNPLYSWFVMKTMPGLYEWNMYLWILPVVPVTVYVAVSIIGKLDDRFKKISFVIGLIGIMVLATTTSYNQNKIRILSNNHYVDNGILPVLEKLETIKQKNGADSIKIWGPDEVMIAARAYDGGIKVLYGEDLYSGQTDPLMSEEYDDWYSMAYGVMNREVIILDEVMGVASESGIDAIILRTDSFNNSEEDMPRIIGVVYFLTYVDENYCMYVRAPR